MAGILGLAFLFFIVMGVLLSYCVFRAEEIRDTKWFVPVGLGCTVSGGLAAMALASAIARAAPPSFAAAPALFVALIPCYSSQLRTPHPWLIVACEPSSS